MADIAKVKRVLEGVANFTVAIRGENSGRAKTIIQRFNVLVRYGCLDTLCEAESQRLYPWCAIANCPSRPGRMDAGSAKKPFKPLSFWKPVDAWREVADASVLEQRRSVYDIPESN